MGIKETLRVIKNSISPDRSGAYFGKVINSNKNKSTYVASPLFPSAKSRDLFLDIKDGIYSPEDVHTKVYEQNIESNETIIFENSQVTKK